MTDLTGQEGDDILVSVKAQVMTRDDNSGGWVPFGEGGYSDVALKRLYLPGAEESPHVRYVIIGQRIADQTVILHCVLKKHMHYTHANPTFHHWNIDDDRYGLTFERATDAKSFDDSVQNAVTHLKDSEYALCHKDVDNDDVFMVIDLPMGGKDSSSQSASTTSTTTSSPTHQSPLHSTVPIMYDMSTNNQHLHRMLFTSIRQQPASQRASQRASQHASPVTSETSAIMKLDSGDTTSSSGRDEIVRAEEEAAMLMMSTGKPAPPCKDYPYVVFTKESEAVSTHVYSYPHMEPVPRPASDSNKKPSSLSASMQPQPPLPTKLRKVDSRKMDKPAHHPSTQRAKCQYCNEYFSRDDNERGACEFAPSAATKCIEYASCMCVAKGVIYHCVSDSEGDYGHLCACDSDDELNWRRWTVLTLLSFFVPCLWCYKPLSKCHDCSIQCGMCGGRHKAT